MQNQFSRMELLIGKEKLEELHHKKIAIFGLGGVGSFVVEGLVRGGIYHFVLVDHDQVSLSNLNRQLIATTNTIGKNKVEVEKRRILEINPEAEVEVFPEFFLPGNKTIINNTIDYIVDCVDTVTAKIELVMQANELGISIISCMGTGNKLDPTRLEVADIYQTSVCPLCKVMRKELRERNVEKLKVIYSKEEPVKQYITDEEKGTTGHPVPGSVSFVPSVAGLIMAGEVIKDLINKKE